jgi:hypothetical protein
VKWTSSQSGFFRASNTLVLIHADDFTLFIRDRVGLCGKGRLLMAHFIWANYNELINLEAVSVIRLVVDDTMAQAYVPGCDKPVVMKGSAAAAFLESFDGTRPSKPDAE